MTFETSTTALTCDELTRLDWPTTFDRTLRGIAISDIATRRIRLVNEAFAVMHGGRREDFVGMHVTEILPLDPQPAPPWDRIADATDHVAFETEHVRLDGSRFPVALEVVMAAHRDGGERVRLTFVEDRTEARANERAGQLFELAFQEAPIGMALVDTRGRWRRVNVALCSLLGRTEEELLQTTFQELTHPDDLDVGAIADLAAGKLERLVVEKRYRHASGRWITVTMSTAPIRDAGGSPETYVTQVVDITETKAAATKLQRAALQDSLTGLANHRRIQAAIGELAAGAGGAVAVIDLDGFRTTNDGYGHAAGDRLLQAVADRLKDCVGPDDVVGRIGGDEFVVVMPGSSPAEGLELGRDLCAWVAAVDVWLDPQTRLSPTASIGVAAVEPGTQEIADVLLAADIALYDAKHKGGNQAAAYGEDLARGGRGQTDLEWLSTLRRALTDHRFELHAQAIVDLETGLPVKHELLLRLRDEDGAWIFPGDFLPAAERLKLMRELDAWVVAEAASIASRFPEATLGINLSGSSVGDPSLPGRIEGILLHSACDPSQLVFEITETEAIANLGQAKALTERLHALGCRFALDDFGSGYASFSHLKQLPLEFIKIDGEFIRELATNADDQLIVEAIQTVARGMDRSVVAEHIEDGATAALLRQMNVEFGQGYHYQRPAPVEGVLQQAAVDRARPGA